MAKQMPDEILVWDTETSGVDVENDRILTCYAMLQKRDGTIVNDWSWTIDPGVAEGFVVAEGAAAVHGMSTEWIAEHGRKDSAAAITQIVRVLYDAWKLGAPIVAYNQRFDFSILWHEYARAGRATHGVLRDMLAFATLYDPLVHDKARDKFRRGNRKLQTVCEHHGIEFNESEAHAADYDVDRTAALTWKLLRKDKLGVDELSNLMPIWKEEQDASLQQYFSRSGKKNEDGSEIVIDRGWPLITKKGN